MLTQIRRGTAAIREGPTDRDLVGSSSPGLTTGAAAPLKNGTRAGVGLAGVGNGGSCGEWCLTPSLCPTGRVCSAGIVWAIAAGSSGGAG